MLSPPLISLVVCTRNRARCLPQALDAFARIRSSLAWELVLVDNGSTDATSQLLEAFERRHGEQVRTKRVSEPQPGVSRAKNAGIAASAGSILAFTDDDCYPPVDHVDRIARTFSDATIAFAGGRVLLYDERDLPITIQLSEEPHRLAAGGTVPVGLIHGANFAFRREVLETIGGFDVNLGPGARCKATEDLDVLQRASAAGFSGAYDPSLFVHHHHRRREAHERQALFDCYDVGLGAYYCKHLADPKVRTMVIAPFSKAMAAHLVKLRLRRLGNWVRGAALYRRMQRSGPAT